MSGASSSAAGVSGSVPVPEAGSQERFLRADGTWFPASSTFFGTCSSDADAVVKAVDVDSTFPTETIPYGTALYIRFINHNTVVNPQLSIGLHSSTVTTWPEDNGNNAKWKPGETVMFTYINVNNTPKWYGSHYSKFDYGNNYGFVPSPDQNADTGKFLKADGTWDHDKTKADINNTVLYGWLSNGRLPLSTKGTGSFAFGNNVTASGNYSHAEGNSTEASASCSHAEGYSSAASGEFSHAEGNYTIASGYSSHAEGFNSKAQGTEAHAEGYYTKASGTYAHSEGCYTLAEGNCTHAGGKFNVSNSNMAEIIGNGTTTTSRSNARAVDWDGNEYLKGDLFINCNDDSTGGLSLSNLILQAPSSIQIPFEGGVTEWQTLTGLTTRHRVLFWNFSTSSENVPPASLQIYITDNQYKIENLNGISSETIRPVFIRV